MMRLSVLIQVRRAPIFQRIIVGRCGPVYHQPGARGSWLFPCGAMGAQVGQPDAAVLSVMGDGSFGFSCGELETLVRYNLPVKAIVFSNASYGWIKAGQNSGFDKRFYNVDFGRTDHAAVAAAFGVRSWTVADPAQFKQVLSEALAHKGPALVDVIAAPA